MSQLIGYTGPITADAAGRAAGRWVPARRPDRQGRRRIDVRDRSCEASMAPRAWSATRRGQRTQVLQTVREAQPGASLTLTIDTQAQRDAQKALDWAMRLGRPQARRRDRHEPADGRGPRDGQPADLRQQPVRARDQRQGLRQALLENPDKPLLNHAVQAHYPPGSTYKLVTGTGGLADKKITATTQICHEGLS